MTTEIQSVRTMKKSIVFIVLTLMLFSLLVLSGSSLAVAATETGVVTVGAAPMGIAANPVTNRIYVANQLGNTVSVIDGATDTVIASIATANGPWDIAVNPATNLIYVTNSGANSFSVIDGATNTIVATTPAVLNAPTGIAVNPATNRIYVSNWWGKSVYVFDGAALGFVAAIPVGNDPARLGVNPVTNKIYVANEADDTMSIIDGATNTVTKTLPVVDGPWGVAVNASTNQVFVTGQNDNFVGVISGVTDTAVNYIPVGNGPTGIAVNPALNKVYVGNTDAGNAVPGSLSTLNGGTNALETVGVGYKPSYVCSNPATNKFYVAHYGSAEVSVYYDATPNNSMWYLAEGTSAWGFSTYFTIENPNSTKCTAEITYNTPTGPKKGPDVPLPALSQTTVNPADTVPNMDFSTVVSCKEGKNIAVDRTMGWMGTSAASPEAHTSIGVTAPGYTWYLAEGSSAWGFECWLLIQNPNGVEATCEVTYMLEGKDPKTVTKKVPANTRQTFNMMDDIGADDASIKVASNVPVIPERAMYRNNKREGHDSIGTIAPATDYYLAEGAVGYDSGYITYVLVQNPQDSVNKVTVTYFTGSGEVAGPTIDMPAKSRETIRLNDQLPPATDVSTKVHGEKPIIAERAMYWGQNSSLGEACHDSIGMASAHKAFFLPDGEVGGDFSAETWTLVSNHNTSNVKVRISYLTPTGTGNKVFEVTIPAKTRMTFNMADKGITGRAAVMVESLTAGKNIMAERAMYGNNRGMGTDTIGGYSD